MTFWTHPGRFGPSGDSIDAINPRGVETEGPHSNGVIGGNFEQRVARTPLGRRGQPDDIASVAMVLASAASGWMTGETIAVGGGFSRAASIADRPFQLDAVAPERRVWRPWGRRPPPAHVKTVHMSWSRNNPGSRGYHHGNLKEALIRAALELIAQKGPAGFTFAEAARSAGVSPAAPYRHFRDRDDLLIDVARRGFDLFAQALALAWGAGHPDPFAAFERIGRAYLEFARTEPAYYSAMFEAGVPHDANAELREAGERAFAVLRTAAEKLIAHLPSERRPPALMLALHVWALAHGVASLFGRADAGRRTLPMTPEELLEAGVLVYLRGLGLPASA